MLGVTGGRKVAHHCGGHLKAATTVSQVPHHHLALRDALHRAIGEGGQIVGVWAVVNASPEVGRPTPRLLSHPLRRPPRRNRKRLEYKRLWSLSQVVFEAGDAAGGAGRSGRRGDPATTAARPPHNQHITADAHRYYLPMLKWVNAAVAEGVDFRWRLEGLHRPAA